MATVSEIKEHMEVVGSDAGHVGTVDYIKDNDIVLTKGDSPTGAHHHLIPFSWVEKVEGDRVHLNKLASEAQTEWSEAGDLESRAKGTT